jgi:hypothetical protein
MTSAKIAQVVWSFLQTKDIRDVLAIGKLTTNVNDVGFVAMTLQRYKERKSMSSTMLYKW